MNKFISEKKLKLNDPPTLAWILVKDAIKLLWAENPKLHDLGAAIESIKNYGFQELPKFDINLENISGKTGAIKAGNGRIEALYKMELDKRYKLPRGLGTTEDGTWAMPILIGTDATSIAMAASYALDSNNITMMGGNATIFDMLEMYNENDYYDLIQKLAENNAFPISLNGDSIDLLLKTAQGSGKIPPEDFPTFDSDIEIEYQCPKCGYEWSGKLK